MTLPRRAFTAGLVTLACALPAVVLAGLFDAVAPILEVALAAVVGGSVATVLSTTRAPGVAIAALVVLAGVTYVAVVAIPDGVAIGWPTPASMADVGATATHGLERLLTVAPPARSDGGLVVAPALVAFCAAACGASLAVRTRATALLLVPPGLVLVGALLLGAGRPRATWAVTTGVVLLLVAVLVVRARPLGEHGPRAVRRWTSAVAPIAAAVAAVVGVGVGGVFAAVNDEERFDPRSLVEAPVDVTAALNPLAVVSSMRQVDPPKLFATVRVDAPPDVPLDRVRLAALDHFDGARWSWNTMSFPRAGSVLVPATELEDPVAVSMTVAVAGLGGPFLPVVGEPTGVDGVAVGHDPSSGTVVSAQASVTGLRYELRAELGRHRPEDLTAGVPAGAANLVALPSGLPADLVELAQEETAGATSAYERLLALERHLLGIPYSVDVPPGSSYESMRRMLLGPSEQRAGDAGQRAAAFAVLTRSLGYPSRVAVGYLLDEGVQPGQDVQLRTDHVHAWPEVLFDGSGWVAFEPTDPTRARSTPPTDLMDGASAASVSDLPATPPVDVPPQQVEAPVRLDLEPALGQGRGGGPGNVPILPVLAVLTVGAPGAIRFVRRHRGRMFGSRSSRVVGAWRDALDRLSLAGVVARASSTVEEVRDRVEASAGAFASPVRELAGLTSAAVFAPEEPSSQEIKRAWELAEIVRRTSRREVHLLRRARLYFDPRAVRGRR